MISFIYDRKISMATWNTQTHTPTTPQHQQYNESETTNEFGFSSSITTAFVFGQFYDIIFLLLCLLSQSIFTLVVLAACALSVDRSGAQNGAENRTRMRIASKSFVLKQFYVRSKPINSLYKIIRDRKMYGCGARYTHVVLTYAENYADYPSIEIFRLNFHCLI